jgi:hypothetical protein
MWQAPGLKALADCDRWHYREFYLNKNNSLNETGRGCQMSLVYRESRVREHTAPDVNERIRQKADASIEYYGRRPELIPDRIKALDREWDIERTLEANAASISLIGLALGIFSKRRWLLLPLVVAGFLLQHAVQGWCPPVPVFRRLGVRTSDEIIREKVTLEILQGRFDRVPLQRDAPTDERIRAVIETV